MSKKRIRLPRPKFGSDDWNRHLVDAELLEVDVTFNYHGRMEVRVTDLETGKVTILVEPENNAGWYH